MLETRADWKTLDREPVTAASPESPDPAPVEPRQFNPLIVRSAEAFTPSWALLLEKFYGRLGRPLPGLQQLKDHEVPEPYHGLLVHSSDMTPTLERFYRRPLELTVLSRELEGESYLREVVLRVSAPSAKTQDLNPAPAPNIPGLATISTPLSRPVEYGVIRICLNHFPPGARRRVLEEQRPLGNILRSEGIPHISWPQAFFRAASEPHTDLVLGLKEPSELYGRRNVLLDGTRRLLAEVIEILAPVAESKSGG
jgi:hypothetical protein